MKYVLMKSGRKIEVDEVPYLIKNGVLYVYMPTMTGATYMPVGEVEKEINE